jgi:hypothetical protein
MAILHVFARLKFTCRRQKPSTTTATTLNRRELETEQGLVRETAAELHH